MYGTRLLPYLESDQGYLQRAPHPPTLHLLALLSSDILAQFLYVAA